MPRFTALFDACVLYPAPVRDLLLELACTELFRARWTDAIHDEWISNLLENRPDLKASALNRTREMINRAVPDALNEGYEILIEGIHLPDWGDRHVIAAAICGRVDVIVTYNLRDFPSAMLFQYGLEAQHPDTFFAHLISLAPDDVLKAALQVHGRLKQPPMTFKDYLGRLVDLRLEETVKFLERAKNRYYEGSR